MAPRRRARVAAAAFVIGMAGACGDPAAPAPAGGPSATATTATASGGATTFATAAPTERWAEVASDVAPLLHGLEDPVVLPELVRKGELLRIGKSRGPLTWEGKLLEDAKERREGELLEAQRSDGASGHVFQLDLGGEVSIRPAGAVCDAIAAQVPLDVTTCKSNLRRARLADGAIVAYVPCATGPCPVAIERGADLGAIALTSLTGAHFLWGKKRSLLVAETRHAQADGKASGGALVVVALDGRAPVKGAEIPTDEVDARDGAHLVSRVVKVAMTPGEIRVRGEITESAADGKVLSKKVVDERHPLPALD